MSVFNPKRDASSSSGSGGPRYIMGQLFYTSSLSGGAFYSYVGSNANYGYATDSFPFPVRVVSAVIQWNANYTSGDYTLLADVKIPGSTVDTTYATVTNPHDNFATQQIVNTTKYFMHATPDAGSASIIPARSAIAPSSTSALTDDCSVYFVYEIVEE